MGSGLGRAGSANLCDAPLSPCPLSLSLGLDSEGAGPESHPSLTHTAVSHQPPLVLEVQYDYN